MFTKGADSVEGLGVELRRHWAVEEILSALMLMLVLRASGWREAE